MRKKPIRLMCLAVMLLCVTVVIYRVNDNNKNSDIETPDIADSGVSDEKNEASIQCENDFLPVQLVIGNGSTSQNIRLFVSGGICYAFLPTYADMSELLCGYDEEFLSVALDGQLLARGQRLKAVETGQTYELVLTDRAGNTVEYPFVFMQSEHLPAVFIDTVSGSLDYVNAVKGNEERGNLICITADGVVDSQSVISKIKGRGNTSWSSNGERNQYNIRLKEAAGVLGMKSARNWVLQSNKFDNSMMKNKLSYDLAKEIGVPYAIDSRFADLYCNGEYMGAYLICEKVEIADNRIDPHNKYLVERDDRELLPEESVETVYGPFAVHSPENMTEGEHEYIADYMRRTAESIAYMIDSDDYVNYIDSQSFAKLYAMNEISNDPDANRLSSFFYKEDESDSKLIAGPVWDFDWAYGYDARSREIRVSGFEEGWFEDLYKSRAFRDELRNVFEEIKAVYPRFNGEYFDNAKTQLMASYGMTMIRWQEAESVEATSALLNTSVDNLQNNFSSRTEYLLEVFCGEQEYHKVNFVYPGGKEFNHTYVEDGTTISEECVNHIYEVYGCVPCRLEDDTEIDWSTYVISEDIAIECRAPEPEEE